MKPFKIQNRTVGSRRVKLIKNGGHVYISPTDTHSFIENSREAGFCLTPINPLEDRDNATSHIALTVHPMGTDGRVSFYINGNLIESKRYLDLKRISDRQAWFNAEFGNYARYTGKEVAEFTLNVISGDTYRFVFEDDDLDFEFSETTLAPESTNPTLIVERYRLAFNLFNNKVEISCDGALYQTAYMTLGGGWRLEMNGEVITPADTSIEDLITLLESHDIQVAFQDEEDEEDVVKPRPVDYTFTYNYDHEKGLLYGNYRPGLSVVLIIGNPPSENDNPSESLLIPTLHPDGRWEYPFKVPDGETLEFTAAHFLGDLDDALSENGKAKLYNVEFGVLTDQSQITPIGQGDIIDFYGKGVGPLSNAHLYYQIDDGDIILGAVDMVQLKSSINVENFALSYFFEGAAYDYQNDMVTELGLFLYQYTTYARRMATLLDYDFTVEAADGLVIRLLEPEDANTIPLVKEKRITFYRGQAKNSEDLFDQMFPNYPGNYITLVAHAKNDPLMSMSVEYYPTIAGQGTIISSLSDWSSHETRLIKYHIDEHDEISIELEDMRPYFNRSSDGEEFAPNPLRIQAFNDGQSLVVNEAIGVYDSDSVPVVAYVHQRNSEGKYELTHSVDTLYSGVRTRLPVIMGTILFTHEDQWLTSYSLRNKNLEYKDERYVNGDSIIGNYVVGSNENIVLSYGYGSTWILTLTYFKWTEEGYLDKKILLGEFISPVRTLYSEYHSVIPLVDGKAIVTYNGIVLLATYDGANNTGESRVLEELEVGVDDTLIRKGFKLNETETEIMFMLITFYGKYRIYKYAKATDIFSPVMDGWRYQPGLTYDEEGFTPLEYGSRENVVLGMGFKYTYSTYCFYRVEPTSGDLTPIPYIDFRGNLIK